MAAVLMIMLLSSCNQDVADTKDLSALTLKGLKTDYCTSGLRKQVETLKIEVAATATGEDNVENRVSILWDWGNARAMAGYQIPPSLPLVVNRLTSIIAQSKGPDPFAEMAFISRLKKKVINKMFRAVLFGQVDNFVREIAMLEKDPAVFGSVTAENRAFPADTFQTVKQTYTVGSRPIRTGAYFMVAQNFFSLLSGHGSYQFEDPKADNYITIQSSNPDVSFTPKMKKKFGMHGGHPWINKNVIFEVTKGQLDRKDTITVTIGDKSGGSRGFKVFNISNDAYQIPLYLSFGDTKKTMIESFLDVGHEHLLTMIPFNVTGTKAVGVHGFAPSIIAVGERFDVSVRSEDPYFNRATGPIPAYTVFLNGKPYGEIEAGKDAISYLKNIKIDKEGTYRFSFVSANNEIKGQSNPIWVQNNPENRIFWGELHGHSGFSEGQGSPDSFFQFGRDDARLDFIAFTEHDAWLDDWEWNRLKELVDEYNKEGEFITFPAYEWTANQNVGGHHNIIFRNTNNRERIPTQDYPTVQELHKGLREKHNTEDLLVIPHAHVAANWNITDKDTVKLVEIFSMHGAFEWFGRMYLRLGNKVGFIAASDDHFCHPGYTSMVISGLAYRGGLAAVMAPSKSSDVLFDAMKNVSTYATTVERIILDVDVNGVKMGKSVPLSPERTIKGRVMGTAPIDSVTIFKNETPVWQKDYRVSKVINPDGSTFIELAFFSPSYSYENLFDSPRGWRLWPGSLEVKGAKLVSAKQKYYNPHYGQQFSYMGYDWQFDAPGPDKTNEQKYNFLVLTRGMSQRIMLELQDVTENTRIDISLEAYKEIPSTISKFRPPALIPATQFSLRLNKMENGKLVHDLPVDIYTDTVTLRSVKPDESPDRKFMYTDKSEVEPGDYYYIKVIQDDGGMAWSSPIWVKN